MKEKMKVFAQKGFFWTCVAIGFVGTLALVAYVASYFIGELDFANAAVLMFYPFLLSALVLRKKISSKIELYAYRTGGDFLLFGGKLFFKAAGIAIIAVVAGALAVIVACGVTFAVYSLADFLVSWLVQQEILSATHAGAIAIVFAICMVVVILYVFSRIFPDD